MRTIPAPLVPLGSLWFASLLLILWAAAMGFATCYETATTRMEALYQFYGSWWFEAILALLVFNTLMSLLVRYRFKARQTGYLLTHVGIIVILVGGLMTRDLSIDGQVGIAEGETATHYTDRFQHTLMLIDHRETGPDGTPQQIAFDLNKNVFGGFSAVENPSTPNIQLGDVGIRVLEYMPDSAMVQRLVEVDSGAPPAVQIQVRRGAELDVGWLRPGAPRQFAGFPIGFRRISDPQTMDRLLGNAAAGSDAPTLTIKVGDEERAFEVSKLETPQTVADVEVRVVEFFERAKFAGDTLANDPAASKPNPAVIIELTRNGETERRNVLAAFPGFGDFKFSDVDVRLKAPAPLETNAPVEILRAPDGKLYMRFDAGGGVAAATEIELNKPLSLPSGTHEFVVLNYFEHARMEARIDQFSPTRENREPAIRFLVTSPRGQREHTIQLRRSMRLPTNPEIELAYINKMRPLGFAVRLEDFRIGEYPGTHRPRSFASAVTFMDPASGQERNAVVSMNHPFTFGGQDKSFVFYQSSYQLRPNQPDVTFLSVAYDPGRPVVYAGYFALLIGMLLMLFERMWDRRNQSPRSAPRAA